MVYEFFWSFSNWLEAVAQIPQIIFISKLKMIHSIPLEYMCLLGAYKVLYLLHWIFVPFVSGYHVL
jgi:ER lumen protein retaining receptor